MVRKQDTRRSGNMRYLIEIQKPNKVKAASGSTKMEWAKVCETFAEKLETDGREYKADQHGFIAAQLSVNFLIRKRLGIDQSMRVFCRGTYYQISQVIEIDVNRMQITADRLDIKDLEHDGD